MRLVNRESIPGARTADFYIKYNATEISQIFGVPMEQIMRIRKEKNL